MTKKRLLALALAGLLPLAGAVSVHAAEPPADAGPVDGGMAAEPADPDASPDPPDGTIDPNATYPTDGDQGTDQGEDGGPVDGGDGTGGAPPGGNDAPD